MAQNKEEIIREYVAEIKDRNENLARDLFEYSVTLEKELEEGYNYCEEAEEKLKSLREEVPPELSKQVQDVITLLHKVEEKLV